MNTIHKNSTKKSVANIGLQVYPSKCSSLSSCKGIIQNIVFRIGEQSIKYLFDGNHERFLWIPIGSKLLFNISSAISISMQIGSLWFSAAAKIEVLRSGFVPFTFSWTLFCYGSLFDSETYHKYYWKRCNSLFYKYRNIGILEIWKLIPEADVLTIENWSSSYLLEMNQ